MKNVYHGIGLWFLLQAIYGCAPTIKVSTDFDRAANFSSYKTYALVDIAAKDEVSDLNGDRIMKAIRENMKSKGFTEAGVEADLLVNAMTVLKEKRTVTANTNYYGYGGIYRPYGYWGGNSAVTFNSYDYVDGSLIIDIVNNKTQKLLWQGIGNAEIDKMPNNPDEFINHAVTKILHGFPPKSSGKMIVMNP
jgi:hypothetical protein